jgi:hypothetical protein
MGQFPHNYDQFCHRGMGAVLGRKANEPNEEAEKAPVLTKQEHLLMEIRDLLEIAPQQKSS